MDTIAHLFRMPSFYGGLTWGTALFLYEIRLAKYEEDMLTSTVIYFGVLVLYLVSTCLFSPAYGKASAVKNLNSPGNNRTLPATILLLHGAGFIGIWLFLARMMDLFGGGNLLWAAYTGNFEAIRYESQFADTIGIQLGYLGWMAVGLTSYFVTRKKLSRIWVLLAVLQWFCSFLYFDRTKPIWILFTYVMVGISAREDMKFKDILRDFSVFILLGTTLFVVIAILLGKGTTEGDRGVTILPPSIQSIYFYVTGGFGYFNQVVQHESPEGFFGERIFYPLFKLLSRLELVNPPPGQIYEFYWFPYPTNVGTFLEVFYREGGILFTLIGMLVYTFGLDALGLWFLRSANPLARFAWANVCYAAFLGFYAPQIIFFPFWLFSIIGAIGVLLSPPPGNGNLTSAQGLKVCDSSL
jgi:hypothetical protein